MEKTGHNSGKGTCGHSLEDPHLSLHRTLFLVPSHFLMNGWFENSSLVSEHISYKYGQSVVLPRSFVSNGNGRREPQQKYRTGGLWWQWLLGWLGVLRHVAVENPRNNWAVREMRHEVGRNFQVIDIWTVVSQRRYLKIYRRIPKYYYHMFHLLFWIRDILVPCSGMLMDIPFCVSVYSSK